MAKHIIYIASAAMILSSSIAASAAASEDQAVYQENLYYGETEKMTEAPGVLTPDLTQGYPFYANPKKPAPMGIWLKAYRMSQVDSDDHVVYFRVNSIVSADVASEDIARFNALSTAGSILELSDPYLEYKEISYDVYYPEDFPVDGSDQDGLAYVQDPTLAFSIVNPKGGGFVTDRGIYVGLSKVQPLDIGFDLPEGTKIHPGEVFHGKSVFAMLTDETDYVLEYACRQSEADTQVIYQYSQVTEEGAEE